MKRGAAFLFFFPPPWGPMACSSHYSPLCPLPPIGRDNTAWQGCQCRVNSRLCFTAPTTRATSQQDGVSLFLAPQVAPFPEGAKGRLLLISWKTFFFKLRQHELNLDNLLNLF